MRARYENDAEGNEALVRFQAESELDRQLLRVLNSRYAVVSLRCKAGARNLLEYRIVVNGVNCGDTSTARG